MEEINLLQNRLYDKSFAWYRQSRIVITGLVIILIAVLGVFAVFYILNSKTQKDLQTVTADNQNLKQQLDAKEQGLGEVKTFQAQLANLKILVNSHIYLSPVLDELSHMTFARSQYFTLNIGEDRKLHLEGRVNSYEDLSKLLLGLNTSSKFKNIQLTSVSPSTGKINGFIFSINLVAADELFTE